MARFEITATFTYDVPTETLENVYGTIDLNEALQIDLGAFEDDPSLFLDRGSVGVKGEIVG